MILYWLVAITIIVTCVRLVIKSFSADRGMSSKKGIATKSLRVFGILLLICPFIPYLVVEINTSAYGQTFYNVIKNSEGTGVSGQIYMLKVLQISRIDAAIYVVSPCDSSGKELVNCVGAVIEFRRDTDGWKFTGNRNTMWSDCGTASGEVFPPYFTPMVKND
jgi:hypothetical protein